MARDDPRAVLPDNSTARSRTALRWSRPGPELEVGFLALVRATAREVPTVLDDLLARGLARPDHLGVAGWSMGGFVAYAAVVADPRLRAAVPLLGAPAWRLPWAESRHRHLERFFPTALLSQTAA